MLKLYCSNGSPFARKVRIVLAEKGLQYKADIEDGLRPVSGELGPTLAVPVLEDGGRRLWDSDLIVDYLLRTYPQSQPAPDMAASPPLSPWMARPERHWDDMTTLATLQVVRRASSTCA